MTIYTEDKPPTRPPVVTAQEYARRPAKRLAPEDLRVGGFGDKVEERFWSRTRPASDAPDGCLLWTGKRHSSNGMGVLTLLKDRQILAHRAAYVLATGDALEVGDVVKHHRGCDPLCCRPEHLRKVEGGGRK